jgi:hypothetical protein
VFGQLESHGKRDMEREKMRMHPIYDKGNKKWEEKVIKKIRIKVDIKNQILRNVIEKNNSKQNIQQSKDWGPSLI